MPEMAIDTDRPYSPPDDFWRAFVEEHWEQSPGLYPGLLRNPIVSREELFDTVIRTKERVKSDRFWVGKCEQPRSRHDFQFIPLDPFGPQESDRNWDGFFRRIERDVSDHPIGVNIHHLQKSRADIWFRFREFVHGLTSVTGSLPTQRWDIDTFFGTYQSTPFGIHRDNASVFAMGVLGKRTYCTWPEAYFQEGDPVLHRPDTESIQPHLSHATRMEVGPGDVAYWPSSHWHVVLSDGSPSAVVQVSAYFGKKMSTMISERIRQRLSQLLDGHDHQSAFSLNDDPNTMPCVLSETQQCVQEYLASDALNRELKRYWLKTRTADAFDPVPGPETDLKLSDDDVLVVDRRYRIGWMDASDGKRIVAANGLLFPVPDAADLLDLIQRLNTGEPATVEEILNEYTSEEVEASTIRRLLTALLRRRAFRSPYQQMAVKAA